MKGARHILRRLLLTTVGTMLVCAAGCEKPSTGPKREDDKAAHSARYHPQVHRDTQSPGSQPAGATTRPFAMSVPAEIPSGPAGSPVLFVNGKPITVQEVLEPILPDLIDEARAAISEQDYYRTVAKIVSEEVRRQATTIVVYEQAKKKLPDKADEVLEKDAERAVQRYIDARFGGVRARYEAHLKALDLTMKDITERAKRQMLVAHFLRERFEPLISEPRRQELLRYYQAHVAEFTTPAKAELFLIEIPVQEELGGPLAQATAGQVTAARQEARRRLERAREEIDSGVEFTAVAKRYSKGAYHDKGGAWGEINPGSLTRDLAKAAEVLFTLNEGQVSDIIETPGTLFIVKCGKKTDAVQLSFEESQPRIVERVREEQYNHLSSQYIGDLIQRAGIDDQQQQQFFVAALTAAPRPHVKRPFQATGDTPDK
jgi:hypothetical protein